MEPADLNSPPDRDRFEARLEAWLREPAPPLQDDGFSLGVLSALPPPATRTARASRRIALGIGAALGVVVAALGFWFGPGPSVSLPVVIAEFQQPGQLILDPTFALALAVTAACLAYVFHPRHT